MGGCTTGMPLTQANLRLKARHVPTDAEWTELTDYLGGWGGLLVVNLKKLELPIGQV